MSRTLCAAGLFVCPGAQKWFPTYSLGSHGRLMLDFSIMPSWLGADEAIRFMETVSLIAGMI